MGAGAAMTPVIRGAKDAKPDALKLAMDVMVVGMHVTVDARVAQTVVAAVAIQAAAAHVRVVQAVSIHALQPAPGAPGVRDTAQEDATGADQDAQVPVPGALQTVTPVVGALARRRVQQRVIQLVSRSVSGRLNKVYMKISDKEKCCASAAWKNMRCKGLRL